MACVSLTCQFYVHSVCSMSVSNVWFLNSISVSVYLASVVSWSVCTQPHWSLLGNSSVMLHLALHLDR